MTKNLQSIRTLLAFAVLSPIIAISVVLLILSIYTSNRIESRLSSSLVSSTSAMVEYKVLDSLRDARWISDLYFFRIMNGLVPEKPGAGWERMMFASISTRPTLSSICFATPAGEVVMVTRGGNEMTLSRTANPGIDQSGSYRMNEKGDAVLPPLRTWTYDVVARPWYQQGLRSDQPSWTPVYAWSLGHNQKMVHPVSSVGYVRNVRRSDGSLLGVLSVDVSLETVAELLGQSDIAHRGTLLILDKNDQVLCAAGRVKESGTSLPKLSEITGDDITPLRNALAKASNPSELRTQIDGRYVTVTPVRPFEGIDWRLAAIVPQDAINAETATMQRTMAIAGVVCVAVALLMGLALSRRIAGPIRSVAQAVRRIGSGEFDTKLPPQNTSELAQLSAAVNDLTRQVQEQITLRAEKEALERSAAAKSALFNRVTHELRTPLNAIIGYAELLEEQDVIRGDPVSSEDLRRIMQASRQLLRLINELLDMAKVDAGRMRIHLADVDIGDLLREVEETARPLTRQNRNAFGVIWETQPLRLHTDGHKLKQILLNLLSNAAKFTHNGEIGLRVRRDNVHVCFSVNDTGIGMAQEQVNHMFEPFRQAEMTTDGTGLGLTITRQLIVLLGGEIEVASRLGAGTKVDVYFPIAAESVLRRAGEVAIGSEFP